MYKRQGVKGPTPISKRIDYIKINGKGNITPVCDAKTLVLSGHNLQRETDGAMVSMRSATPGADGRIAE